MLPTLYRLYPAGPTMERPGSISISGSGKLCLVASSLIVFTIAFTNSSGFRG